MANHAEFKTALASFLRNWVEGEWFPEHTEEEFQDMVEQISSGKVSSF